MLRPRGCLTAIGAIVVLLLICCALSWFVAVPRMRDSIRDELADNLATNVAVQIAAQLPAGQQIPTGEFRLSVSEIENQIRGNFNQAGVEGVRISAAGGELVLDVDSGNQTLQYRGVPTAANGKLVMADMEGTSGWANLILPPDKLGQAIEQGVNDYFAARNVRIDTLQLSGDEIVVQTSPQP